MFDATLTELRSGGYDALTLSIVASRAGVARETLFRDWHSKQHLVLAAIDDLGRQLHVTDRGELRDDLLAHLAALTTVLGHPGAVDVLTSLMIAARTSDAAAVTLRIGPIAARRLALARTVRAAQEQGRYPALVHPSVVADAIVGPLCYKLLIARESLRAGHTEQLVDLVLGAYVAHPGISTHTAAVPSAARKEFTREPT